jgi:hypothetical protein
MLKHLLHWFRIRARHQSGDGGHRDEQVKHASAHRREQPFRPVAPPDLTEVDAIWQPAHVEGADQIATLDAVFGPAPHVPDRRTPNVTGHRAARRPAPASAETPEGEPPHLWVPADTKTH